MSTKPEQKAALRSRMRSLRKGICSDQRKTEQNQAIQLLRAALVSKPKTNIGFYLASGSEFDPHAECEQWHATGTVYVPVLAETGLRFAIPRAPWRTTAFNTREPCSAHTVGVTELDALLVPLLACDHTGMRLGQGGGWYDRTLTHAGDSSSKPLPTLIGIGFEQQLVSSLPSEKHDYPLDLFLSAAGWRAFTPRGEQWLTGS